MVSEQQDATVAQILSISQWSVLLNDYNRKGTIINCNCSLKLSRLKIVNFYESKVIAILILVRYDDWLNGKDYGRHPEEPNATLTPAPPPTAEEFMVNIKNRDKEIPLCLLEPKPRKRRHPIHKNKIPGRS